MRPGRAASYESWLSSLEPWAVAISCNCAAALNHLATGDWVVHFGDEIVAGFAAASPIRGRAAQRSLRLSWR